jgi:hypothetical protein
MNSKITFAGPKGIHNYYNRCALIEHMQSRNGRFEMSVDPSHAKPYSMGISKRVVATGDYHPLTIRNIWPKTIPEATVRPLCFFDEGWIDVFGHCLWEISYRIYFAMLLFSLPIPDIMIVRDAKQIRRFKLYIPEIFPNLKFIPEDEFLHEHHVFDMVVIPNNHIFFQRLEYSCQIYPMQRFREWLINRFDISYHPEKRKNRYIKKEDVYREPHMKDDDPELPPQRKMFSDVSNLPEVLKEFKDIEVWKPWKQTLKEQIQTAIHTKLLIGPTGNVTCIAPFIKQGTFLSPTLYIFDRCLSNEVQLHRCFTYKTIFFPHEHKDRIPDFPGASRPLSHFSTPIPLSILRKVNLSDDYKLLGVEDFTILEATCLWKNGIAYHNHYELSNDLPWEYVKYTKEPFDKPESKEVFIYFPIHQGDEMSDIWTQYLQTVLDTKAKVHFSPPNGVFRSIFFTRKDKLWKSYHMKPFLNEIGVESLPERKTVRSIITRAGLNLYTQHTTKTHFKKRREVPFCPHRPLFLWIKSSCDYDWAIDYAMRLFKTSYPSAIITSEHVDSKLPIMTVETLLKHDMVFDLIVFYPRSVDKPVFVYGENLYMPRTGYFFDTCMVKYIEHSIGNKVNICKDRKEPGTWIRFQHKPISFWRNPERLIFLRNHVPYTPYQSWKSVLDQGKIVLCGKPYHKDEFTHEVDVHYKEPEVEELYFEKSTFEPFEIQDGVHAILLFGEDLSKIKGWEKVKFIFSTHRFKIPRFKLADRHGEYCLFSKR